MWLLAAAATSSCALLVSLDSLEGDAGDATADAIPDAATDAAPDCGACPGSVIAATGAQPGLAAIGGLVAWTDAVSIHLVYEDGGAFPLDAALAPTNPLDPYAGEMAAKGGTFLAALNSGSAGFVHGCTNDALSCFNEMSQLNNAYRLVADSQGSYVVTASSVAACNSPGTCGSSYAVMLPPDAGPFKSLALSSTMLFWSNGTGGTIASVPRDAVIDAGATPTTFVSGQSNATELASDATNLYWVEYDANAIHACPLAGCTSPTLVYAGSGYGGFTRMVSDGAYLYFLATQPPAVLACPVSGCVGQATLVMGAVQNPMRIALTTHDVVVADWTLNELLVAPRL